MKSTKRPVSISIRSREHSLDETQAECFDYEGFWFEKGGKPFILFEEALEDGTRVHSTIRIDPDKVAVLRHEKTGGHMILDPLHHHKTRYLTPYGVLEFFVTTQDLRTRVHENHILIQAEYSLQLIFNEEDEPDANQQDTRRILEIKVIEKTPTGV